MQTYLVMSFHSRIFKDFSIVLWKRLSGQGEIMTRFSSIPFVTTPMSKPITCARIRGLLVQE